ELFALPPQDLLFQQDDRANSLKISLADKPPKYAGTIQIDAMVDDGVAREQCTVRCVPESGRVDRVLIHFLPRRETAPRWTLGGEDDRQISARKLSADEQTAAGWNSAAETWEVKL